jgi:hypothetical protein
VVSRHGEGAPSGVADGDRHSPTLDSAVVRMVQGGCEEERWSAGARSGVGTSHMYFGVDVSGRAMWPP